MLGAFFFNSFLCLSFPSLFLDGLVYFLFAIFYVCNFFFFRDIFFVTNAVNDECHKHLNHVEKELRLSLTDSFMFTCSGSLRSV